MCGIAGFLQTTYRPGVDEAERNVRRMVSSLSHRGPDDEACWVDAAAGVALGHRRLAILDLSVDGRQPMHSVDGRYVLVFNGEIYNFRTLRRLLESHGHPFRGHSDTEVMLAAIWKWGLPAALDQFTGMFAFALWDRRERTLSLVRDRAGEKPLYYGWAGNTLVFGSELKALRAHPDWRNRVHRGALAQYLRQGYIASPHSVHESIWKLPPGCRLTLSESHVCNRELPAPAPYWSPQAIAASGTGQPFAGNDQEAEDRLRSLLNQSVARQMISDVPLGAFLSGGIDSSLVVALMQSQSARPVKTFSIGFDQGEFDEAPHAKAVARHLGTDHTELYITNDDLLRTIPRLASIYDEPFADASQIPTVLLCRLAASHVKVCLTGDAGDELFGGYELYRRAQRIWRTLSRIPGIVRSPLGHLLGAFSKLGQAAEPVTAFAAGFLNRLRNLSDLLPAPNDRAFYQVFKSSCRDPHRWLLDAYEEPDQAGSLFDRSKLSGYLQWMCCVDFATSLPDDILVKVDRAAMAVGLETRVPMLDHRVVEFAWNLPESFKQRGDQGKWILGRILGGLVPGELVDRPKAGFAAPIAHWLRGPLRPWAESLLDGQRLRQEGHFEAREVGRRWRDHLSGRRDWSPGLWRVLVFQAWLDEQKNHPQWSQSGHEESSERVIPLMEPEQVAALTCHPTSPVAARGAAGELKVQTPSQLIGV